MNTSRWLFFLTTLLFTLSSCSSVRPAGDYNQSLNPLAPDYASADSWAALPEKKDPADRTPKGYQNQQKLADADVFFLHPTTYTGGRGEKSWNAPIDDEGLNKKTDKSTILHQASIFNGAARVFAPRYRQAHIHAYFSDNSVAAKQAFQLAYEDVKAAFQYYLEHYNEGRPVIIAGHSQGTTHAIPLLKEFFEGKPLIDQLVVAYLVGMPVEENTFKEILPCQSPSEIGCYCSWRSFERDHTPRYYQKNNDIVVTNPLTWTIDTTYADKSMNEGTMMRKFGKIKEGIADAQVHDGILWVNKPKFFGSLFLTKSNYHIADFNLFYLNVRKNAIQRVEVFQRGKIR